MSETRKLTLIRYTMAKTGFQNNDLVRILHFNIGGYMGTRMSDMLPPDGFKPQLNPGQKASRVLYRLLSQVGTIILMNLKV